jgi:phosphoribosylanthranilate isomerase
MSLTKYVLISRVSNLSDARYCAGMMVDALSFNLNPSKPDYVSPTQYEDITQWVVGPKMIGELSGIQEGLLQQIPNEYALDSVLIDDPKKIDLVKTLGYEVIVRLNIDEIGSTTDLTHTIDSLHNQVSKLIIHSNQKNFKQIDDQFERFETTIPLIRSFGIDNNSIQTLPNFWDGIELFGHAEERPGFHDYGAIMDILEYLEEE